MRIQVPGAVADTEARVLETPNGPVPLRTKEARLLEVLYASAGVAVSRERLNAEVFDYGVRVASRTLDTTIRRLRQKLEQVGAASVVQTVHGEGYRFLHVVPEISRSIVGYEEVERQLVQALSNPGPVLVTGPGGVGKTALVHHVLGRASDLCVVACVREMSLAGAVLEAVGLASAYDGVAGALALRPGLRLVLDDAEAVGPASLQEALAWCEACPSLHLVFVSRRATPKGIPTVELGGLSPRAARVLFLQHLEREPSINPGPLLAMLEHHPLSIVLAASRVRLLGMEAFTLHLGAHPDLLGGSDQGRERSLGRILETTLALLSAPAREALVRMSAVEGTLDPPTLQAVVGSDAMAQVVELLEAHLVVRHDAGFVLHARTLAHLSTTGPPEIRAEGERQYLEHLGACVRNALPYGIDLPPIEVLTRAAARARRIGHPRAALLQYGLCRALQDVGDVQQAAVSLDRFDADDPHIALVEAHLTRQAQPGTVAVVDRVVALCDGDLLLSIDAYLQRASVLANHQDREGTVRDLAVFEERCATLGAAAIPWAWLWSAIVTRFVDPAMANERIRRLASQLDALAPSQQLRWYETAAVCALFAGDLPRALILGDAGVTLADDVGSPVERSRALAMRLAARWRAGDLEGSRHDVFLAAELSAGGPRWLQKTAANNLGSFAMHMLNWERAQEALSNAIVLAGASERSRLTAEIQFRCLEREMGIAGPEDAGQRVAMWSDERWFLWPAQCGDLAHAVTLAESAVDGVSSPNLSQTKALDAAAEIFVAAGRWEQARHTLDLLLPVCANSTLQRGQQAALRATTYHVLGLPHTPDRALSLVPYARVSAEIWWCAHDALVGDPEGALTRLAALREEVTSPMLTERSILSWRLDAAERIGSR